jgi:hypothetical protein
MVARGPHREEGGIALASAEPLDRVEACSRGSQRCIKGGRNGDGVLIEVTTAPETMVLDALDVRRVVNDLELFSCRLTGLELDTHLSSGRGFDACEHRR